MTEEQISALKWYIQAAIAAAIEEHAASTEERAWDGSFLREERAAEKLLDSLFLGKAEE